MKIHEELSHLSTQMQSWHQEVVHAQISILQSRPLDSYEQWVFSSFHRENDIQCIKSRDNSHNKGAMNSHIGAG